MRGVCGEKKQICECNPGWIGPNCLTRAGSDSIVWDPTPTITDVGYYGPLTGSEFYILIGFILILGLFVYFGKKSKNLDGWRPIPEDYR